MLPNRELRTKPEPKAELITKPDSETEPDVKNRGRGLNEPLSSLHQQTIIKIQIQICSLHTKIISFCLYLFTQLVLKN